MKTHKQILSNLKGWCIGDLAGLYDGINTGMTNLYVWRVFFMENFGTMDRQEILDALDMLLFERQVLDINK